MTIVGQNALGTLLDSVNLYPNKARFSLFLGAGCSVDAGVPTAWSIVNDAVRELYSRHPSSNATSDEPMSDDKLLDWACSEELVTREHAYSSCLESLFPHRELRQKWLERYFRDVDPTPQHFALGRLAKERTVDAIFTTNFDRLVESASPNTFAIVSHERQSQDVSRGSPTLYKLHGDYLFQSIKNTVEECASLHEDESQAIRRHVCGNGLIVIGYGGGDESVMSALDELESADLPLGLWWLVQPGLTTPASVQKLHDSLAPMMQIVECEGFSHFVDRLEERTQKSKPEPRYRSQRQELWVEHENSLGLFLGKLLEWESSPSQPSIALVYGQTGIGKTRCANRLLEQVSQRKKAVTLGSNQGASARTPAELEDSLSTALGGANWRGRYAPDGVIAFIDDLYAHEEEDLWRSLQELAQFAKILVTCRESRRPPAAATPPTQVATFEHPGLRPEELTELASQFRIPSLDALTQEARDEELRKMVLVAGDNVQKLITAAMLHQDKHSGDSAPSTYSELVERTWDNEDKLIGTTVSLFAGPTSTTDISEACGVSLSRVNAHFSAYGQNDGSMYRRSVSSQEAPRYEFSHDSFREYWNEHPHPSRPKILNNVKKSVLAMLREHGGRPISDSSNFRHLDYNLTRIRGVFRSAVERGHWQLVTRIFKQIFSYMVDRGRWAEVKEVCEKGRREASDTYRPAWLVWSSWIALYMDEVPDRSRDFAAEAVSILEGRKLRGGDIRELFEAHRRLAAALRALDVLPDALTALGKAQDLVEKHRKKHFSFADDDDLQTLKGEILIGQFENSRDEAHLSSALDCFHTVIRRFDREESDIPTEYCLARLRAGQVKLLSGAPDEAYEYVLPAVDDAEKIEWWRGLEIGYDLSRQIFESLGSPVEASLASGKLEKTRQRLRGD